MGNFRVRERNDRRKNVNELRRKVSHDNYKNLLSKKRPSVDLEELKWINTDEIDFITSDKRKFALMNVTVICR